METFHLVPISFECVFCWKIFCQVVRSILPSFDLWRRLEPWKDGWDADGPVVQPTTKECQRLQDANDSTQLKLLLSCNLGLKNMAGYHGWISWLDGGCCNFPWWWFWWPFFFWGESGARVWMSDTLLASHLGLWKPRWGKIVGWWSSEVSSKNRHALAQMIQVLNLRSGIEFWRKLP